MIITSTEKYTGQEFVRKMENKYKSVTDLEKLFKKTNNMKMYVDLKNWKYFKDNPEEEIEISESYFLKYH